MLTPEPEDRPSSVLHAARSKHSTKPSVVYDIIEQMYPNLTKIELFARHQHPGWDVWGNQVRKKKAA
jgi:N6-adenosine-specific RNA methylase IME4